MLYNIYIYLQSISIEKLARRMALSLSMNHEYLDGASPSDFDLYDIAGSKSANCCACLRQICVTASTSTSTSLYIC